MQKIDSSPSSKLAMQSQTCGLDVERARIPTPGEAGGDLSGEFLTTQEVANICKLKPGTLEKARSTGLGNYPCYHKVGRKVLYKLTDVLAWLASCRIPHGGALS